MSQRSNPWAEISERLRRYSWLDLADAFGVTRFAEELSEEFDLLQIAGAPGANEEVQFQQHPLPRSKRSFH